MSSLADNNYDNLNKNNANDKEEKNDSYNKDEKTNDDNEIKRKIEQFKCLKKKNNETLEQFLFRGKIFLRVYEDTKDEVTAIKYSNIWVNILSLSCTYQKDVMELVEKYRPSEEENIYKSSLDNK